MMAVTSETTARLASGGSGAEWTQQQIEERSRARR